MGIFDDIAAKIRGRNKEAAERQAVESRARSASEAERQAAPRNRLYAKVGPLYDYLNANLSKDGGFTSGGAWLGETDLGEALYSLGSVLFYKVSATRHGFNYGKTSTTDTAFVFGFDFSKKRYVFGEYQLRPGANSVSDVALHLFDAATLEGIQSKVIEAAISHNVIR